MNKVNHKNQRGLRWVVKANDLIEIMIKDNSQGV